MSSYPVKMRVFPAKARQKAELQCTTTKHFGWEFELLSASINEKWGLGFRVGSPNFNHQFVPKRRQMQYCDLSRLPEQP